MNWFKRRKNHREAIVKADRSGRVRERTTKPISPVQWFPFHRSTRRDFYRYVRDNIPLISSSVWAWVRLCTTPQKFMLQGSTAEKQKAEKVLKELGYRIYEGVSRKDGVRSIIDQFFLEIFTVGRFAGEVVFLPSRSGINYFRTIDPYLIQWEKKGRWIPFIEHEGEKIYLNNERFFYFGLGSDTSDPAGVSPIASIPFVTEIEERMLEDMAYSSHNAGTPRLHVKITPLEPLKGESQQNYAQRLDSYFEDTVEKFRYLDPDDNIFTWSDVEVSIVGGQAGSFSWRINREQIIEDVITGMRLFPWVVGRTHGTTKNWVQAQFNLLMQEVDSIQEEAKALADWLRNLELQLRGIDATASHQFAPNQDPFILDKAKTQAITFDTVDKKVNRGYISKEDGAKELGYLKAYRSD